MLAFDNFLEAFNRIFEFAVLAFTSGELGRDVERLREEFLNLARARNDQFVFVRQFIETKDRDDVLKIFVTLKDLFYRHRGVVMILADDARIQDARRRTERIDRRINSQLNDLSGQCSYCVEVREGRGRRRISIVVRRNVDRLDRSDRSGLG